MGATRAEARAAFIAGYFETNGNPDKLDYYLGLFGFSTIGQERADYDDSEGP